MEDVTMVFANVMPLGLVLVAALMVRFLKSIDINKYIICSYTLIGTVPIDVGGDNETVVITPSIPSTVNFNIAIKRVQEVGEEDNILFLNTLMVWECWQKIDVIKAYDIASLPANVTRNVISWQNGEIVKLIYSTLLPNEAKLDVSIFYIFNF